MIRLTTISILVCLEATAFGQNSFHRALTGLSEIDYVLIPSTDCHTQTIQDDLGCIILPIDNWYNQRIRSWKSNSPDTIDHKRIKTIESFAIKGTKELQPKTYGRADVIKWTFVSIVDAKNAEMIISKSDPRQKEDLYKAPWTWWRDEENFYFILTGGTYVKPDLSKIERKLKEKLNGG